jgi:hypothetical protein
MAEFSSRLLVRILDVYLSDNNSNSDTHINEKNVQKVLDTIHQVSLSILSSLCHLYTASDDNSRGGGGSPLSQHPISWNFM